MEYRYQAQTNWKKRNFGSNKNIMKDFFSPEKHFFIIDLDYNCLNIKIMDDNGWEDQSPAFSLNSMILAKVSFPDAG